MMFRTFAIGLVHGVFVCAIAALFLLSAHENELIDRLVDNVVSHDMSDREKAVRLTEAVHEIIRSNAKLIGVSKSSVSLRQKFLNSVDMQFLNPTGHCGSYAIALSRVLQRAGLDAKPAQMLCGNGEIGCHMLVVANVEDKNVPFDAMYNHFFVNTDSTLASYTEVSNGWESLKVQLPQNYPQYFDYHDVNYTNWNKIPIIMPILRDGLTIIFGEKVTDLSIRSYVLNVYKTYGYICLFLYLVFSWFSRKLLLNAQRQ